MWWVLYLHYHLSIIYLLLICVGHWYETLIMTLCSFQFEVWILPLFARSASSLSRCQLINKSQKLVRRKLSERHWSLKVISCQILHEHSYYLRICLRLHWTLNWQERWRNEVYSILLHKFHTLRSIVLYCNYCTYKYFHVIDLEMRIERCLVLVQTLINTICLLVKLRS